jgi:argininosuccinate lyase
MDALELSLRAMRGMIGDMQPQKDNMARAAGSAYSTATDLADWLVRNLALPFRDAHHSTGAIVAMAEKQGKPLHEVPLEDLQKIQPQITENIYKVLSPENSCASRTSYGGTAPENVRAHIKEWQKKLANNT